jgi:hypothetical protein
MRRIALSAIVLTFLSFTVLPSTGLRGSDPVDALRPENAAEVHALLRRIEQLERRVRQLEAEPKITRKAPAPAANWFQFSSPAVPPPVAIPFEPHNHDGVLRADQVKIYMHYQTPIQDTQTAGTAEKSVEPAGFRSGGITITR